MGRDMKTIMVVDDETDVLEQVKSSLEEDDYEVITVSSSRKALELLEGERENDFDLILIDTPLPGQANNLSALFSMVPKSKTSINMDKDENFLQKPFTREQLVDFIKSKMKN
jgi:CheY-like chemotaxis protein